MKSGPLRQAFGRRFAQVLCALVGAALGLSEQGAGASSPAVASFRAVDSMQARVQGCVTCHGHDGQGSGNGNFPRIAGKPAGYLYHQLAAFRDGTRHYAPMNYLVAYLPDDYLKEIAEYFSRQRPAFVALDPVAVDTALLARGQSLAVSGDADKGIPACSSCHGERLTGREPGIPGLVGLRSSYIAAQLTRWRVGERHAIEPDCMRRIATRLSESDVGAVAAWVSRQEVPKDLDPSAGTAVRLPLSCGSQR